MTTNKTVYFFHGSRIYYPTLINSSIANQQVDSSTNDANISFGVDTVNNQYFVNQIGKRPNLKFPPFLGKN